MKKIIALMSILILLLTACQQKPKTKALEIIKETYPEATIEVKKGKYFVYSDSDLTDIELPLNRNNYSCAPYDFYDTVEELLGEINLLNGIVFVGEKMPEPKQCIEYTKDYGVDDYYTDTKVKVTKVFYGDINVGDEIVYREEYAVIKRKRGTRILSEFSGHKPVSQEECLYIVKSSPDTSIFDLPVYCNPDPYNFPFSLLILYEFGPNKKEADMHDHLYEKYFIDGDTTLYESEELEKATKWKGKNLTKNETAKIKELVKRYNDMAKQ